MMCMGISSPAVCVPVAVQLQPRLSAALCRGCSERRLGVVAAARMNREWVDESDWVNEMRGEERGGEERGGE